VVTTILVVDDEPDARYLLRHQFERAGFQVTEAEHGRAAISAVQASAPALVVTDVMMPVMDGRELIEWLRADPLTSRIPIIAVSGHYDLALGADVALDKFGDLSELIPITRALLENGRESR
jgi:CheY-like chemotaxis protein